MKRVFTIAGALVLLCGGACPAGAADEEYDGTYAHRLYDWRKKQKGPDVYTQDCPGCGRYRQRPNRTWERPGRQYPNNPPRYRLDRDTGKWYRE